MPPKKTKHLLIDGYNIIHAWPELKRALETAGPETARERLCDIVRVIHDVEEIHTTIVFDGQGSTIQIERPTPEVTFSILYSTNELSADSLIEQLACKKKKKQESIVATQDNLIRQAVSAAGGTVIGADDLLAWVKACEEQQYRNIKKSRKSSDKKWKQHNPWDKLK